MPNLLYNSYDVRLVMICKKIHPVFIIMLLIFKISGAIDLNFCAAVFIINLIFTFLLGSRTVQNILTTFSRALSKMLMSDARHEPEIQGCH
jgi:hypothetical protein